ncbi:signal peptide peptidase SppA, partial [Calditrichota bacterium]
EVINSIGDQFYQDILTEIGKNRGIEKTSLEEILNNGPYAAEEAKNLNLVDDLFYEDQLKEFIESNDKNYNYQSFGTYKMMKPYKYEWEVFPPERIAIVYATGNIVSGVNSDDFLLGETMGDKSIAEAIRAARENKDIGVIILRIDSGGGFAVASEIIWREVALTTEGENKKPLIVSMSDAAASGGYFIACPADEIYADPATITGSIGIIMGKFNLEGLFDKLGIKFQHIKRGDNAGLYTGTRGFTEKERQQVINNMEAGYDRFISKVAEGRNMSKEEVNEIGRGRVWTGTQSVKNGLVDGIGGLYDVIKIAENKAGIEKDEDYAILLLPEYGFVWPFSNNDYLMESQIIEKLPNEIAQLIKMGYKFHSAKDEPYMYLMPYDLIIE